MHLTLSESLYAYDLLLKQGKLLISEMASRDVDEEDTTFMKAFGYQYYYYYLYYYFNNVRRSRVSGPNLSQSQPSISRRYNSPQDDDIDIVQNDLHSTLMESVYVGRFCDVIPRDSSLAPVKLFLGQKSISSSSSEDSQNTIFAFTWNMFDSIKSIKIFTKLLCKDHNLPFDESLPLIFEKQVLEASIVESDFALLVEMLAMEKENIPKFKKIFKKKMTINLTPGRESTKKYEDMVWDLLNSDSDAVELVKKLIKVFGVDENQLGTILYYFKRDIMSKKKEMIVSNSIKMSEYSQKHQLRTPFICRRETEFVIDEGPFLLTQKLENSPEVEQQFRTSYKERLNIISEMSKNSVI